MSDFTPERLRELADTGDREIDDALRDFARVVSVLERKDAGVYATGEGDFAACVYEVSLEPRVERLGDTPLADALEGGGD